MVALNDGERATFIVSPQNGRPLAFGFVANSGKSDRYLLEFVHVVRRIPSRVVEYAQFTDVLPSQVPHSKPLGVARNFLKDGRSQSPVICARTLFSVGLRTSALSATIRRSQ